MIVENSVGNIQMVDLKNQYLKIKPTIDAAIQECIDTTSFIKGPQVIAFEHQLGKYLNVKHAITCANGTDALQLAVMALGLEPGDEVIVPAFTYVAAAEVIALLRLQPVVVDVDPHTFTINQQLVEEAISSRTKLVIPVHLFGQCADMAGIKQSCSRNNMFVVEDNAQAIGALYMNPSGEWLAAGTIGDIGTTSFFPSKNLGCFGDGGAVYTNQDELASKLKMVANHGQSRKYYHDSIGINSRLDSIQAAILIEKLKHLEQYTQARQQVADLYDEAFKSIDAIETPYIAADSTHVFHQYTLKVPADKRDGLKEYLAKRKIPSMIYYPVPLNQQKAYKNLGRAVGDLAVAKDLCSRVLSLPIHTELSEAQVNYISETVIEYFS